MIRFDDSHRFVFTEKDVEEAFQKYAPKNTEKKEDDDEPP